MDPRQAHRMKPLEKQNQRVKRIVADQALDMAILKVANRGNYSARQGGGWQLRRGRRWLT